MAMEVRESEQGLVRLFAVDLPPEDAKRLFEAPDRIAVALGLPDLDATHVDTVDMRDLAGLGLQSFLAEGHGIPDEDLAPHAPLLAQQSGALLVLRSSAILTRPTRLTPAAPLRWIATFGEERPPVPIAGKIESDAASGLGSAPAQDPQMTHTPWLLVTVLALAIVLTFAIWLVLR